MAIIGIDLATSSSAAAVLRGGRGDLDLRIEVKIPERLTAEERALYEKLRGLDPSHRWGRRK